MLNGVLGGGVDSIVGVESKEWLFPLWPLLTLTTTTSLLIVDFPFIYTF